MRKLLVVLSGLLIAVNLYGQNCKVDGTGCTCPSCIAKAAGKVLPYTLPALQGLNAELKNGSVNDSHDGHDHTSDTSNASHEDHEKHAGCNHGNEVDDHEAHDDHEGHDHTSHISHASHEDHEDHVAHEEGHDGHDHAAHAAEEAGIKLSPEMIEKMGIKVSDASGGAISTMVIFPAEIKLNRDRSSEISARYSSVVRQVFVEIGDEVKKGDLLASLENRQTMAVYSIAAPIDGVVVSKSTSVGEAAGEEKVLFEVADLSTVWADISIFPRFRHKIKKDVPVEFIAHDGHTALGKLKYISPLVSQETRTYTARCVLKGAPEDFAPGAFVRAKITIDTTNVNVRIERDAVQLVDREPMVFVPNQHGFESRAVQVGAGDAHFVEITNGLEPGESYVAIGSFSLKAEMVTSGMDPHAGHGH